MWLLLRKKSRKPKKYSDSDRHILVDSNDSRPQEVLSTRDRPAYELLFDQFHLIALLLVGKYVRNGALEISD